MDLKRAWRNGFLVTVIFAIPLSDLYNNQLSNLVVDNSTRDGRVAPTGICGTHTPCVNLKDVNNADDNDKLSGVPSSWDNNDLEGGLTIPKNVLAGLLPESGETDSNYIQLATIQFDPDDIFLSEAVGEISPGTIGSGSGRPKSFADFVPGYA
ncbi:MAG TPA: hypothetical protein VFO86_14655, partial [Terriglobia bacterium]|nr:hypothetical protein [Terriglobia bacterium]